MPIDDPDYLTADELAARLRVKVSTVYDAAARGNLPVVRLWAGKKRSLIRFRREDIELFLEKRSVPAQDKE